MIPKLESNATVIVTKTYLLIVGWMLNQSPIEINIINNI